MVKRRIGIISSQNLKDFLKKRHGIDKYEKTIVTWTETDWLKKQVSKSDVKLLTFKEIAQRLIDHLKKKRGEAGGWVGVPNLTLLVLQTILHFKSELKL